MKICYNFLDQNPKHKNKGKNKTEKWGFVKLWRFYKAMEMNNRVKTQVTDWKKDFARHLSAKGLILRMYEEFTKFNSKNKHAKQP